MENCEIRWCQKPTNEFVGVDEVIGDAAYRAYICRPCASAIGVKENDVLPDPHEVKRLLDKAKKA